MAVLIGGDNPLNRVAGKIDDGLNGVSAALDKANGTTPDLLDLGYIRRNPDYPKHASEPFVFTSLNCEANARGPRLCLRNTRMIAPRP